LVYCFAIETISVDATDELSLKPKFYHRCWYSLFALKRFYAGIVGTSQSGKWPKKRFNEKQQRFCRLTGWNWMRLSCVITLLLYPLHTKNKFLRSALQMHH